MPVPILATKLFIPSPPSEVVLRPRLVARLNAGLQRKLSLISAPAGFGKTTLLSAWAAGSDRQVAWLSLDDADNDPTRFLLYLIAAVRTIVPTIGQALSDAFQSPQPPPTESTLIALINELTHLPHPSVIVLDDYHVIDARPVDAALAFLVDHLPPRMHLVIATREDPQLPLARLRGRGQLSELRVVDLRFTPSEAAEFLNQTMSLDLSAEAVATLETRTEGWIAGLQLAALSLQGHSDAASFIQSFSGSHHFVLDYLLEEVLQRQSESIQTFLLRTSILDRLCGPLCDAVLGGFAGSGQATLEHLQRANLFLVPLDDDRRWYRYHHLFADLLRQRLASAHDPTELHRRASQWYEDGGLEVEAFHHAAAAKDVDRAERLIDGHGVPLQFRGAGARVLRWLESLPKEVLDARPALWVTYATALFFSGRHTAVEPKLQAAESALSESPAADDRSRDLVGRIASIRATLAIIQHDAETIIGQSRRALAYLRPDNLPMRTAATYTLGYAHQLQGERAAASRAFGEVISASRPFVDSIYAVAATLGLGQVQETDNELFLATRTYGRVLELAGDPPRTIASEAHLGLGRVYYEWNELDRAHHHARQCLELTRQMDSVDTFASYAVFLARMRLAQGDLPSAVTILDEAEAFVHQHNFLFRMRDIAAARVPTLLRLGDLGAATRLADMHQLPLSQARVYLAGGDTSAALAVLEPWRQHLEARGWADQRLKVMILQALALQAHGDRDDAVHVLVDALTSAEPGGFVRSFVDEGLPLAELLSTASTHVRMQSYVTKLLTQLNITEQDEQSSPPGDAGQRLIEPLSHREVEILQLITAGLSNRDIGERLFLALDTVKGHNRKIFGKLQVQRRTEAVARARELGLA